MLPETLFTIANALFLIATIPLFLKVIKNRKSLKDFDFIGSILNTMGMLYMFLAFIFSDLYVTALFAFPTLIFWFIVSIYSFKSMRK